MSGTLVYLGLSSKVERNQTRIKIRTNLLYRKEKLVISSYQSKAEILLKQANYPLGLTGLRYYLIVISIILILVFYYILVPLVLGGTITKNIIIAFILIVLLVVLLLPHNPYSLFVFTVNKVINYIQAKRNAEIFMLYDLLINEIEMMNTNRINSYNIIRNLKPYFNYIQGPLSSLFATWSSDEGPIVALDNFSKEIGTKEVEALVSVIKTLDNVDHTTALLSLRGMHNMFIKGQIENYRRRRKLTTDLMSLPIKITHFIIILNFLMVVITMVTIVLNASNN